MTAVIRAENLGKCYRIRHQQTSRYNTVRDELAAALSNLGRRRSTVSEESFWALRDVDFEVLEGERLGIIGRNGAGKSTLLKLLSRITQPTSGRISIRGRVASLLEVGTGFHPELSGRENIFLNGAILGMTRHQVQCRFDEIVDFAEVERFLDTPVKRYSSGMYTRLAFAVAAHLEPDIMIVDEVLAVGDAAFQKKCLGKMHGVAEQGRTVIFVSHNMQAVKKLCTKGVVLDAGRLDFTGDVESAVTHYLEGVVPSGDSSGIEDQLRALPADPVFRFDAISVSQRGKTLQHFETGEPIVVNIDFSVFQRVSALRVYADLCDEDETVLVRSFHDDDNDEVSHFDPGSYSAKAIIPGDVLGPVSYVLVVRAGIHNVRSLCPSGIRIPLPAVHTGRHNRAYLDDTFRAKLILPIKWSVSREDYAE